MAPIIASKASANIESLSLPPVNSSPLPSLIFSPILISLAFLAKESSHTILALSFVSSPSDSSLNLVKICLLITSSKTASPKNSNLSLCSISCFFHG